MSDPHHRLATRAWVVVAFLALFASAQALRPAKHAKGVLGPVDWHGNYLLYIELGEIDCGDQTLPVFINYSSDPKRRPSVLGRGWSIPLLESTVYLKNEKGLRWEGMNGRADYMRKDRKAKKDLFLSGNGQYQAIVEGSRIYTKSGYGWTFIYEHGQLQSFKNAQGSQFRINYTRHGKPSELRQVSPESRQLFALNYTREGQVESYTLNGQTHKMLVSDAQWISKAGNLHFEGLGLHNRTEGKAFKALTELVVDGQEERYRYVVSSPDTRTMEVERGSAVYKFLWDLSDGCLLRTKDYDYTIEKRNKPGEFARISRTGKSSGQYEVWDYDTRNATYTTTKPDGTMVRQYLVTARGPAFQKARKVEEKKPGGSWETTQRTIYNEAGQIERVLNKNGEQIVYEYGDDLSKPLKRIVNDQIHVEYFYGRDGKRNRLIEYQRDGSVVETWVDAGGYPLQQAVNGEITWKKENSI